MRTISLFFGVCVAAGLFAGARTAAADLAPAGLCLGSKAGDACDDALDESGQVVGPGICVAEQCSRATPDGPMTYACVMCRPKPDQNAGGAGGSGGDPVQPVAGAATGGSENAPKPSAGSGPATAGSAPTAGSSTAGTSGTTTNKPNATSSDDGGCSIGTGARGTGLAGGASLLFLGLALRRRRAQRRAN